MSIRKFAIFAIIALLVLLGFILLILSLFSKSPPKETINISPTPSAAKSPSIITKEPFFIKGTDLSNENMPVAGNFTISFSQPILLSTLEYQIIPDAEVLITFGIDGKSMTVSPVHTWDFNTTYQFTIKNGLRSVTSQTLNSDYLLNFKTSDYVGF